MTLEDKLTLECNTVDQELQYLVELRGGALLNFHNDNTVIDGKEKSPPQVLAFHKSWFAPKAKEVERKINERCDWKWDKELGGWKKDLPVPTGFYDPNISDLDYIKGKAVDVADPFEDLLNDYNKVDPNNRFTISGAGNKRVDIAGMTRIEDAYFWRDMGVDFWSGNWEILFTVKQDTSGQPSFCAPIAITNDIDDLNGLIVANKSFQNVTVVRLGGGGYNHQCIESDSGTVYADTSNVLDNSKIFTNTFERDNGIGVFGTIFNFIREGAVLIGTLSVPLHTSKKKFKNTMIAVSFNNGVTAAPNWNGYIENVDLQLPVSAAVIPPHIFQRVR